MKAFTDCAKSTFINLPEEKRDRILREAVREFAAHGYRKASVNAIVDRLGIAKGSLYQYFANKEALFLFVFEQFTEHVKDAVRSGGAVDGNGDDFFGQVQRVLEAGIRFIDSYPEYYQIYLKVLFEPGVPAREELIARVRLFSAEYFGPYCQEARRLGLIRADIPDRLVYFILDAVLDRFLQGYARPYLDGGLLLPNRARQHLKEEITMVIHIIRDGLSRQGSG